jgi:4-hydroxymandelate oxidase
VLLNLFDYEANAERALPPRVWDAIAGGAKDEITTRRNRLAFHELLLRPRRLRNVDGRSQATTVLGETISLPVMLSPAGVHNIAHPDGEKATAIGAGRAGTLLMLSTFSSFTIEEVAAVATGPLWFQLYYQRDTAESLLRRAASAGYKAIVITVDVPVASPKERDLRHTGPTRTWPPVDSANLDETQSDQQRHAYQEAQLTFGELADLKSVTSLPLVIKGIMTAEDARDAVDAGADAILVSNHGGRVFDGSLSSIEALPEVVAAVGTRAEIYLDSGIRRGTDVIKALALGARAVSVGRPFFYGLAAGGADGVVGVLEILRAEIDSAMANCGVTSFDQIDASVVRVPDHWIETVTRAQAATLR